MEDINFADIKIKQNKEFSLWIKLSIIAIACTIFVLTIITIKEIRQINIIKKDIQKHIHTNKELNAILTEKRNLIEEKTKLTKQLNMIHALKEIPKKKLALLTNIYTMLPQNISIESIAIKKTNLDITIICNDNQTVDIFIQTISDFPQIRKIKIVSIKNKNNQLIFTLKGKIEKI